MKFLTIIGARPHFVKAVVDSRVLRQTRDISGTIVRTGWHFKHNMSQVFVESRLHKLSGDAGNYVVNHDTAVR